MALSKSEKIIQYSIMIIALAAVVVSVWQGRISQKQLEIQREYNRLTVKPYLNFATGWIPSGDEWEIVLTNEGIGPAIVKHTEFIYQGQKFNDWDAVLEAANVKSIRAGSWNLGTDSPFSVDKSINFLKLRIREGERSANIGIATTISYESIYGESFELSFNF
jgi:hypothetical protein